MPDDASTTQGPRIVVGISTSPASRHALEWAARQAAALHGVLHVVFAWQYPFEMADGTYVPPMPGTELEAWAKRVVDDEVAALGLGPSVTVVCETRQGPPAAVLMEAGEDADLLVVGTSAHGRITGLLLGSTTQFLTVHAPCPVVVVHGPLSPASTSPAAAGPGAVPSPQPEPAPQTEPAPHAAAAHTAATTELGVLEEIGEEECLALLAGRSIGRLVVVRQGEPLAFPMNYVLDGQTVAVRTDPGTKLDAATLGRVAFEVDDIDPVSHEGWSVLVKGVGRDVTDGVDAWSQEIRATRVEPWAEGEKRHWVAIGASHISGRRIRHRPHE